jgi:hypothetical protein
MHSSPPERRGKRYPDGSHDQLDVERRRPAPGSLVNLRRNLRGPLGTPVWSPQLRQRVAKCVLANLSDEGRFCVVSDAAQGAENPPAGPASTASPSLRRAAMAGLRQPIVAILLLIALFTSVSGKPLDGFLMLAVAALLIFDATRPRRRTAPGHPATAASAAGPASSRRHGPRRLLVNAGSLAAGALYCAVVGSFRRYSWPATASVVALGCLMIAIGWQGSLTRRQALRGVPLRRAWMWAVVLVTGGALELSSLLKQPHLATDSYAHPTISALTDPVLASSPGRSAVLGGWLLTGWYLVSR